MRLRPLLGAVALAVLASAALGACAAEPPRAAGPATSGLGTTAPGRGATGTAGAGAPGTGVPRTTAGKGEATITRFEMPASVTCHGSVDISIIAKYATTGATSVAFLNDGTQVRGTAPTSGTFDIPLRCDGTAHTIVLSAVDDQGRTTVQSKAVLTSTEPAGD